MSTTTAANTCPAWCDGSHPPDMPEHWSGESNEWPKVTPSNDPLAGEQPFLLAHPTWCEIEGTPPGVSLWIHGGFPFTDVSTEMTPDQATTLGLALLRAGDAARTAAKETTA